METPKNEKSVGEIVRRAENDFINGTTTLSKYVNHSLNDTIERIHAYLNSKHISGEFDSLGRPKPFFQIGRAAANIWFRATDIDRRHIRGIATKSKDWINSFLITVHLRVWMRKANFGTFLNEWGRTLAQYGSAMVKFVENDDGLTISVVPWSRLIVDAVDADAYPKIEILELTIEQLYDRIETHGYDAKMVESLEDALKARETIGRKKKDTRNEFIKVYELHGKLSKKLITGNESDARVYAQQMHAVCFVAKRNGRKTEYDDFTLYKGLEKIDPFMLTHLMKEDDRTLAIGAIEHLFDAQWMVNHSMKSIQDQLDIASKLLFQTSDPQFLGMNALQAIENGQILIHQPNAPLTQIANNSHDTSSLRDFMQTWKNLGNEIVGISEAMLGAQPKSGTAWRQTEALLQENYSLFELFTENKGLQLETMFRTRIIPWIKRTQLDSKEEITDTLLAHEITQIDSRYIKSLSTTEVNKKIKEAMIRGELVTQEEKEVMLAKEREDIESALAQLGSQRFFKPSELSDKTWKEQLKDVEWDLEVDITGEGQNTQEILTTLATALKVVVTPGFEQNKRAQRVVGKILEQTGAMSPVEWDAMPKAEAQAAPTQQGTPDVSALATLKARDKNIQ